MTPRSLIVAAAVVMSAVLINPMESAAQRQRSPGGNGNGRQEDRGGRERQRENGGGPQRENGGGRQRDEGGARPQGGSGRAEVRTAQPLDGGDRGRRESPSEVRESAPPPQTRSTPLPETRSEAGSQGNAQARRRFPTAAERADATSSNRESAAPPQVRSTTPPETRSEAGSQGNGQARRRFPTAAERADATSSDIVRDGGNRATVIRDPAGVRPIDRSPNGSRVAVPRDRSYPRGYNAYRNYGGRNVYVVPRGRTYYYYPRYYYHPYAYGYGPAGRGHFYFDLSYNSYIWHPYSVYRYDTYGSYGYPVGELRLRVHPSDAQVFIDGSYAGRVDDFDGVFQSLRLEEGEYQVEIVLPGFEPLAFNVRIYPGEKTTYEGDLIPELP
jgi:PEGA domain